MAVFARALKRSALGLAVACAVALAPPAGANQSSIVQPVAGPHSATDLATNYLNPALLTLLSHSSGASAPANGPNGQPVPFQVWANTSTTPPTLEIYDGAQWVPMGVLNQTSHVFAPQPATFAGDLTCVSSNNGATLTCTVGQYNGQALPTGLLKASGNAFAAATACTDYQAPNCTVPVAALGNAYLISFSLRGVQLNTTGDTPISIQLPTGFSLYYVNAVRLANPSAVLSTGSARVGVYTAASQGGTAICSQQAVTSITTTAQNTTGNMLQLVVNGSTTTSYSATPLYFNVGTANGSNATIDVTINIGIQG